MSILEGILSKDLENKQTSSISFLIFITLGTAAILKQNITSLIMKNSTFPGTKQMTLACLFLPILGNVADLQQIIFTIQKLQANGKSKRIEGNHARTNCS